MANVTSDQSSIFKLKNSVPIKNPILSEFCHIGALTIKYILIYLCPSLFVFFQYWRQGIAGTRPADNVETVTFISNECHDNVTLRRIMIQD